MTDITSKHLTTSSELLVLMPLKSGLIEADVPLSYATRLRAIFGLFSKILKTGVEEAPIRPFADLLDGLRVIDQVNWTILNNDEQLLLVVNFKRAWEPYIRTIFDDAGRILDLILCGCQDYEQYATDNGFAKFAQWVRTHQINNEFYYSSSPNLTIDDNEYLQKLELTQRSQGKIKRLPTLEGPLEKAKKIRAKAVKHFPEAFVSQGTRILDAFYRISPLFRSGSIAPAQSHERYLRDVANQMLGNEFSEQIIRAIDQASIPPEQAQALKLRLKPQLKWLQNSPDNAAKASQKQESKGIQPDDLTKIQGNILTEYKNINVGCMALVRFSNNPTYTQSLKRFLENLTDRISTESNQATHGVKINVHLTYAGLKTLGAKSQWLSNLPKEFQEGMEARAGLLGDLRGNHPINWNPPHLEQILNKNGVSGSVHLSTIDAVIQFQKCVETEKQTHYNWSKHHPLYGEITTLFNNDAVHLLAVEPMARVQYNARRPERTGHFQFKDNISQPWVLKNSGGSENDKVAPGELILGYPNAAGDDPSQVDPFFTNSSFLVIRKLKQNVSLFNRFLTYNAFKHRISKSKIKAKMMGRTPNGTPLVKRCHQNGSNNFNFNNDPDGALCPLHSHIRRANPRHSDMRIPRIMRRGMSYGPPYSKRDKSERGLFFMAYNANIAEQFEVIQSWISGGNSSGAFSAESDPILGVPAANTSRPLRFDVKKKSFRMEMNSSQGRINKPDEQFVELEWGMYLFTPSIDSLWSLITQLDSPSTPPSIPPKAVDKAHDIIKQLKEWEEYLKQLSPRDPEEEIKLIQKWKHLLEETGIRQSGLTAEIWAAIRAREKGRLMTPYGLLVADEEKVLSSSRDWKRFTVSEYQNRMETSLGRHYLGMDADPDANSNYNQLASWANKELASLSEHQAFTQAHAVARGIIKNILFFPNPVIDIKEFGEYVFAILSQDWFGIPDYPNFDSQAGANTQSGFIFGGPAMGNEDKLVCPIDFIRVGRYVFNPGPAPYNEQAGQSRGRKLLEAGIQYVESVRQSKDKKTGKLVTQLFNRIKQPETLAALLLGQIHGFVVPTYGCYVSVCTQLIADHSLWRLQQDWRNQNNVALSTARNSLLTAIIPRMRANPVPQQIYRTTHDAFTWDGLDIAKNTRVILCLDGAAQGDLSKPSTEVLFGGNYGESTSKGGHPCPGQAVAMGVIQGILAAILEAGELTALSPSTLSVRPFAKTSSA